MLDSYRCASRSSSPVAVVCAAVVPAHTEHVLLCRKMLEYASGAVTKNQAEKKLNSLLDFMSTCQDNELLQRFYEVTLQADEGQSNERLWFKTNLKLCDLWFQAGDFAPLSKALRTLNQVRRLHTALSCNEFTLETLRIGSVSTYSRCLLACTTSVFWS